MSVINAEIGKMQILIRLKQCVRSQVTRLKLQKKSFSDLEHGISLWR